jgi:hypothetical protein
VIYFLSAIFKGSQRQDFEKIMLIVPPHISFGKTTRGRARNEISEKMRFEGHYQVILNELSSMHRPCILPSAPHGKCDYPVKDDSEFFYPNDSLSPEGRATRESGKESSTLFDEMVGAVHAK